MERSVEKGDRMCRVINAPFILRSTLYLPFQLVDLSKGIERVADERHRSLTRFPSMLF